MSSFERPPSDEQAPGPAGARPLIFLLCFALFAGGIYLMSHGADVGSGVLFSVGLLASGLAFLIPIQLVRD